jgi:hypothetical protein
MGKIGGFSEPDIKVIAQYIRECVPEEIEDVIGALSDLLPNQDSPTVSLQNSTSEKILPPGLSYLWSLSLTVSFLFIHSRLKHK